MQLTMNTKLIQGQFKVLDSFAIRRKNEFYIIGQLINGTIQEKWYFNLPFNKSLSVTVKITAVEEIEIHSEENAYKLLIVTGDKETINFLLALKISNEYLDITMEGGDEQMGN